HPTESLDPAMPGLEPVVTGATRDQPAHAVGDDRQALEPGLGPDVDELLESLGQLAAVLRDVAAGVVAGIDRRLLESLGDRGPVVDRAALLGDAEAPRSLRAHQAVDEQTRVGPGLRYRQRRIFEQPRLASVKQLHRDC